MTHKASLTAYLNWIFYGRCGKDTHKKEAVVIFFLLAAYLYLQESILLGRSTFVHDGILWYGMFHYFAESLWSGFLPTWNPYIHGGEPFYYAWGILRLLDPVTLAVVLTAKIFNPTLFDLYHYNYIIRILVTLAGMYIFYRSVFERFFSVLVVMLVSFSLSSAALLTVGSIDVFCWLPWMMYFLLRLIEGSKDSFNFMALSYLLGITFGASTYHWTLLFYYALIFLLTAFIWQREKLKQINLPKKSIIAVCIALLISLSLPIIAVMIERPNIYPVVREYNKRGETKVAGIAAILGVDYEKLKKRDPEVGLGNYDYLLRFLPYGKHYEYPEISLVARVLFIIGLLFGAHRYKYNFLVMTFITYILYIGPIKHIRLLHQILFYTFPPLWLVRHLVFFEPLLFFSTVFFMGLGSDCILTLFEEKAVSN